MTMIAILQAAAVPATDHTFNQGFTLQGTVIMVGLLGSVLTILTYFRKVRRENEADARGRTDELKAEIRTHNESVEKRLTGLESKSADFMPRAEIEAKIEHEKNNRAMADAQLKARVDRHDDAVTEIRVDIGRISERHANLASGMEELKALMKDLGKDTASRFDKLQDLVAHHPPAR